VAKRAGVIAGGLFHCISTKQDLIQGTVARYLGQALAIRSLRTDALGGGMEAEARAVVQQAAQSDQRSNVLAAALFAAVAPAASHLTPVHPRIA
jgi:hypothetical protein